jgi:hypothetical protein
MDIYAEINKKQLKQIEKGEMQFVFSAGIQLTRKKGSRACYFFCEDKYAKGELVNFLEDANINWQEND